MHKSPKVVSLNPYTRSLKLYQRRLSDHYLVAKIEDIAHKSRLIEHLALRLEATAGNENLRHNIRKVLDLSATFLALVANPKLGEKDRASQMLMAGYTLKRQQRILKDLKPTQATLILRRLGSFLAGSPY